MRTSTRIQDVLSRLKVVQARSDGRNWECICPCHEDTRASLSVGVGDDGRVLLKCQRNCTTEEIVARLGLKMADLFEPDGSRPEIVATYDYRDEEGTLLYQCVRFAPKTFRQRRPTKAGKVPTRDEDWMWNLQGVRRVLYRLPELLASAFEEPTFIVEGEKDADALAGWGLTATTNAMGAGKWRQEYNESLRARQVVILPDNDDAGREHAQDVAVNLAGIARSIKILALPGLGPKGDVSDWIANGGTREELLRLADEPQSPREEWEPPVPLWALPEPAPCPIDVLPDALRNYVEEVAWATHSPPDFALVPALAVASGAIGNSLRLAITKTHVQSASLWTCVVGAPGTGKTPALAEVCEPAYAYEKHLFREFKDSTDEKRELKRAVVSETTTEKLIGLLRDNPRGLTKIHDELAALFCGFDQYHAGGRGNDRQIYLGIWSHSKITVDRKSNPDGLPISTYNPYLAITGGLQPDVVEYIRGASRDRKRPPDDGFLDRFLLAYPSTPKAEPESWRDVSSRAKADWLDTIDRLYRIPMEGEGDDRRPWYVKMTPCGCAAWLDFTAKHADEVNAEDFPDYLRNPWSKLRGYCARLALLLHYLRLANSSEDLTKRHDVDGDSVTRAATLIAYFKQHTERSRIAMGKDTRVSAALHILRWLANHSQIEEFSRHDLYASLRRSFDRPEALDCPLSLLCQLQYLREIDQEQRRTGRKPTQKYRINPLWERSSIHEMCVYH